MKKIINIKSNGVIPEMGYLNGPILVPCKVDVSKIELMLKRKRKIVELNPENYNDTVELTLENLYTDNFSTETKHPEEPKNEDSNHGGENGQVVNPNTQQNNQNQNTQKETNSNQNNQQPKNNKNNKKDFQQKQAEQTPAQENSEEPKNEKIGESKQK